MSDNNRFAYEVKGSPCDNCGSEDTVRRLDETTAENATECKSCGFVEIHGFGLIL